MKNNRDKMVTKVVDEEHFKSYFNEANKKLLVIDLHPQWAGPCEVMFTFFAQLATNSIDDFKNRVDLISVDIEKVPSFRSDKFSCTSRPKYLLAIEGKIIHEVNGSDLPRLEELIRKEVPYI